LYLLFVAFLLVFKQEGLMYREGYPPFNEGEAAASPAAPKSLVELVGSMTSAAKASHSAPAPSSFEPPLEELLGLDLSSSTTEEKIKGAAAKATAAPTSISSSALPSDLDDLLNMGLSARKSGGAGVSSGSVSGKKTTMPSDNEDDDLELDDLLGQGQPKPLTSSVPAAAPASKAEAKKLSALDAGDY